MRSEATGIETLGEKETKAPVIEQEPFLSFEEFIKIGKDKLPTYNNFFHFFRVNDYSKSRTEKPFFRKFKDENPALYLALYLKIRDTEQHAFDEVTEKALHDAYKILRSYDGVTDKDLFD